MYMVQPLRRQFSCEFLANPSSERFTNCSRARERPMTPFESLLWNIWLPKVRSCINNEWLPENPLPAVKLFESWSSFLPAFIRDNFLDQLVLPKIQKAVLDWNPRKDKVSLQTLMFPWLPHVGLRLEDFVGDARRKVKGLLRSWCVGESKPVDFVVWRDVSRFVGFFIFRY
jgi:tuftelin-interacting protein 11